MAFDNLKADIDRYVVLGNRPALYYLLTEQGLWAAADYRFNHWVRSKVRVPIIRQMLRVGGFLLHKLTQIVTGVDLPSEARIGAGLYIGHFGGIIVSSAAVIGENCNLSPGVVIGIAGRGESRGVPRIGDRVFVGAGAKLFGPIRVGNDAAIGANAVVTKDVPDKAVVAGIPARVVSLEGSGDFVIVRRPVSPHGKIDGNAP